MHDVVVIGAGLAGLRCAAVLAERGLEVVVLEAADAVGGRQRTDIVDGFRLDRGFQVLNPAYPALRRSVDLDALALRSFPVGVQVRTDRGVAAVRHPLRHPSSIASTLRSGLVSAADAVAFARWLAPAFTRRLSDRARDDRPLREAWDAAGLRGPLRTAVLEPFLAGVVAEADGVTSNAFVQELVRYFARGRPGLPAQGIAAVPAQLAARARAAGAEIRLGARAERIDADGAIVEVGVAGGDALRAGRVVVAVGPEAVAELAPVPRPATNGLQTWWFAATHAPSASALLRVDGRGAARRGPVVNTAVVSHTVPSYAPAGRHLIEATCLLPRGVATAGEDEVRRHLAELWDAEVTDWQLLRRDDIPDALPTQPSPLRAPRRPRVADRVYLAGDHRDAASIQGALASGERAARAVLVDAGGDGRRGAAAVGGAHRAAGDRLVHRVRDGGDADVEHRWLRRPVRLHPRDRGVSRRAGRVCRRGAGECGDRVGPRHPPELVGACRRDRAGGRDHSHRDVRDSRRDAVTCAPGPRSPTDNRVRTAHRRGPEAEQTIPVAHRCENGTVKTVRHVVLVVALLNLAFFLVEFTVALTIGAVSLFADSVDFLEDALINLLIFAALPWTAARRRTVGSALAFVILIPAIATIWMAVAKAFDPVPPPPGALTITAVGALLVNLTAAFLLVRHRHHRGSLTKAAWLSARNDALTNLAIIAVGILTFWFATGWLDIIVGAGIGLLNADAARAVWMAARAETDPTL